ncbi:MAG: N-acetyltransferase [Myxococcota bacterium]|jgi:UDP-2-acetamido-3-amino-2,3-dideoxy-glucuronate N-acetyltransferase|nr:N-acetyltransferase [Myxococcota bacterium]
MTEGAEPYVHPSAIVEPGAELGAGVRIWHFCHVLAGARIGAGSMLGQGCFVGARARLGEGVRVQNGVSLYDGVELGDQVFVGPNAVFTNVKYPRAFVSRRSEFGAIRVGRGATVGANATLLPGVELGEYAFVAAGAVVTRNVAAYGLVRGVPGRPAGWVSRAGERLRFEAGRATCPRTGEGYQLKGDGIALVSVS